MKAGTAQRLLIVGGAGALLAACGGGASTSSSSSSGGGGGAGSAGVNLGTPTVKIDATDKLLFVPISATAHVGDIIQWTDMGTTQHTVTFGSQQSLSDPSLTPGGTWEVKFSQPGTYNYTCTVHPGMNGTITVN